MITTADISIINAALAKGQDVSIQNTPDGGCRIIGNSVKVLKRIKTEGQHKNRNFAEERPGLSKSTCP